MVSAYKNNNDTLMTWDIFQHQEQRMMHRNADVSADRQHCTQSDVEPCGSQTTYPAESR